MSRLVRIALVTFMLAGFGATARADGFGSIAYSQSTGNYGWSYGKCNRSEAAASATSTCGVGDCRSLAWEHNECVALSTGPDGRYGWAWNSDVGTAESNALAQCGFNCVVARWVCS
jgi:hypothetical protein